MRELLEAEQPEIDRLDEDMDDMLREFFTDTITVRTIHWWEDFLGFARKPSWPIERRRERVAARLMASAPMTVARMKELIERVGGVEVELIEHPEDFTCTVRFIGKIGVPRYLDDIKLEVNLVRPFHIWMLYEYLFAVLSTYAGFSLNNLGTYTLEDLANAVPLGGDV